MNIDELNKRLAVIDEERKWIKRAIKVIEDGEKFQTKEADKGEDVQSTGTGSGSSKGIRSSVEVPQR